MSVAALLLAAQAVPASAEPQPMQPLALLQTFRNLCLGGGERQAAARAAGFQAVPVAPSTEAGRETAAWENNGIRLFELSGQADPYLLVPATCGVSANVEATENEQALEAPFIALPEYLFLQVTRHGDDTFWNLVLSDAGLVRVSFDRTQPGRSE